MAIRVSNFSFQALINPTTFERFVEDVIAFDHEPFRRKIRVSNFSFQGLVIPGNPGEFLVDGLEFDETIIVFNFGADFQPMSDVLELQDTLFSPSHPQVFDVLDFQQEARSSIVNDTIIHTLGLHDAAISCFGVSWEPYEFEDDLGLEQSAGQGRSASASNVIVFVDSAATVAGLVGDGHFIDFQQTAVAGRGYNVSNELLLQGTIETESDFLRSVSHSDIIQHASTFYIDNGCNRKGYTPFVGEGLADSPPPPRMVFDSSLVLESVLTGVKVVLRNPETDDNDRLGFARINRETRGGELNVFGDPTWAEVNTLIFTITALPDGEGECPDTMEELLSFMQDTLGEEIFLHDWTGTSWRGVITTPNEAATEDGDGYWTVTFEFEGSEEPGSVPQNVMAINHAVVRTMVFHRQVSDPMTLADTASPNGDIRVSVTDPIAFVQTVSGTHEDLLLFDDFAAGSGGVTLNNTSPTFGTGLWRSHTEIKDDGTMNTPVQAGAYFNFTPVSGTRYELTMLAAFVDTYNPGDNSIFGFFEGKSVSGLATGLTADGSLNPTCAKAVHLMRQVEGGSVDNAYRRGTDSDGTADTKPWTDATLRDSPDDVLDLRIILDTRPSTWTAQWFAKGLLSPNYTEVGPATPLLSEDIGAVGWANDSTQQDTELTTSITLKELKSI